MTVSSMPAAQVTDENDPTCGRRTATDKRQHVRMTNNFFTDPGKLAHVADPIERMLAKSLLAASIGLCDSQGTDGHIMPETVLAATGLPAEYGKLLIVDNSWHQAGHGCRRCPQPRLGHIYVHDFLLHNRSAEQKHRTSERRRQAGQAGLEARWDGHERRQPTGRGPGRPRKVTLELPAAPVGTQLELSGIPTVDGEIVVEHPAETRARAARRGRPARTGQRQFDPVIEELCNLLADEIAGNDPDGVRPNVTDTWRNQCRLMIEKDNREPEKIRKAILWCQKHSFWHSNIKSMSKLREKYATLSSRALEERKQLEKERSRQLAVTAGRRATAPAAVAVSGMSGLVARQMGAARGGMVKGA